MNPASFWLLQCAFLIVINSSIKSQSRQPTTVNNTTPHLLLDTAMYPVSQALLNKEWPASWISVPGYTSTGFGVYIFRKTLIVATVPKSVIVHVSADNRYKLFVNGTLVSLGPARGDLLNWNYETINISKVLKPGKNCLAALVWNEGDFKAQAQLSMQTAFILQGEGALADSMNTNQTWKCSLDPGHEAYIPKRPGFAYLTGPAEKVDYNKVISGWENPAYNDKAWLSPKILVPGSPKGIFDWNDDWMLIPRRIPLPELYIQRLKSVRQFSGLTGNPDTLKAKIAGAAWAASPFCLQIPAHTKATVLLDQSFLTNAFMVLRFTKGRNAGIALRYAESLFLPDPKHQGGFSGQKPNRNQVDSMVFMGKTDTLVASGLPETFTSLSYRTFRYVQLSVETFAEPLEISDLYGIFCGYPFVKRATFESSDSLLTRIFETGWRTARACAVETYMDCPYYEQLQYIGDTRIQAMVSLYNSGDDRLMRNALEQLDNSRTSEGITLSRYPAVHQIIPPFSLYWIGMLYDYYSYRPDREFVRARLRGSRQILQFFARFQDNDLLLSHVPYWNFTDWARAPGWDRGVAPLDKEDHSAIIDLQLLYAYQLAARLENDLGDKQLAERYMSLAVRMKKSINSAYYVQSIGLYADNRLKTQFSQHTAALSILTNLVSQNEALRVAGHIMTDTALTQATIYYKYYVNQAIMKAMPETDYTLLLDDWRNQLKAGLSTWAEISDIPFARSDCHAWGASPSIELLRTVLGVNSSAPGFAAIRIEPHPGRLTWIKGSVPHPAGLIFVEAHKSGLQWNYMIKTPLGIPSILVIKGHTYKLNQGENRITI